MKTGFRSPIAFVVMLSLAAAAMAQKGGSTCPICHMALAAKASKANPTAVRLKKGGKILYCCPGCKMPASMLVKKKK